VFKYDPDADIGGDPDKKSKKDKGKSSLRGPDFELNLGKVIDTLNTDYPYLFFKPLDYSIYI